MVKVSYSGLMAHLLRSNLVQRWHSNGRLYGKTRGDGGGGGGVRVNCLIPNAFG